MIWVVVLTLPVAKLEMIGKTVGISLKITLVTSPAPVKVKPSVIPPSFSNYLVVTSFKICLITLVERGNNNHVTAFKPKATLGKARAEREYS